MSTAQQLAAPSTASPGKPLPSSRLRHLGIATFAACLAAGIASAQAPTAEPQKTVRAVRTAMPPSSMANSTMPYGRKRPSSRTCTRSFPTSTNRPPRHRDLRALRRGCACMSPRGCRTKQPNSMTANVLRQGETFWGDDLFAVIIDPFNDQRERLPVPGQRKRHPHGGALPRHRPMKCGIGAGSGRRRRDTEEEGWTAEMAIPFKTLSFDPNSDTWGINFRRDVGSPGRANRLGLVQPNSRPQQRGPTGRIDRHASSGAV